MLLRMLELDDPVNYPVTRIVFADTRFEFPSLYDYIEEVQAYLDKHYPHAPPIEKIKSDKSWEDWFYGEATRGETKGQIRGAPLKLYPCWWSREAKVLPLQKAAKEIDATYEFIGIATDEKTRLNKTKDSIRYPLDEWKWTEADCLSYLDHLDLTLDLYAIKNRIGCYHCIKQSPRSWYSLWLHFPDLWKISKWWDEESIRVSGRGLLQQSGQTQDGSLAKMQAQFEKGFVPKGKTGMECRSCDSVAFSATGVLSMDDFEDGEAFERQPKFLDSHLNEAETVEWIPPSHANAEHIKAASFQDWFLDGLDENPDPEDCFDMG